MHPEAIVHVGMSGKPSLTFRAQLYFFFRHGLVRGGRDAMESWTVAVWSANAAWLATTAVTVLTIHCALAFTQRHGRMFTALAMFAMSWAVLLPYYGRPDEPGRELLN